MLARQLTPYLVFLYAYLWHFICPPTAAYTLWTLSSISVAPFPPMLLKWGQGQPQCLCRGEFVRFFVKALNADRYEWIFNGASIGSASTYNFQVAPSTCGVYKCLVHNRHSTVATPPTRISMSDEPTGCSVTECMYETRFSVGIIPRPSTAIGECC